MDTFVFVICVTFIVTFGSIRCKDATVGDLRREARKCDNGTHAYCIENMKCCHKMFELCSGRNYCINITEYSFPNGKSSLEIREEFCSVYTDQKKSTDYKHVLWYHILANKKIRDVFCADKPCPNMTCPDNACSAHDNKPRPNMTCPDNACSAHDNKPSENMNSQDNINTKDTSSKNFDCNSIHSIVISILVIVISILVIVILVIVSLILVKVTFKPIQTRMECIRQCLPWCHSVSDKPSENTNSQDDTNTKDNRAGPCDINGVHKASTSGQDQNSSTGSKDDSITDEPVEIKPLIDRRG